jgi:hypothetical protein
VRTLVSEFQRSFQNGSYKTGTPNRHYHYAYCGDKDVKKGDWALVHNGTEFGVVEIKRVIPGIEPAVTKHVIEVLTQSEFDAYKERNKTIDEMRSNLDALDYRLAQHKRMKKYEELAEDDPGARKILDELKSFFGMNTTPAIETTSTAAASNEEPTRTTKEDLAAAGRV